MNKVTIKKIVNGGKGLAKLDDGMTLFVKYVLPGETVQFRKPQTKKGFATAELKAVIAPHQDRTSPYCPYYTVCGGCDLMHCCYSTQIQIKKQIIQDLLERQPDQNIKKLSERVRHPIESNEHFYYRQRIRLQVNEHADLGYRAYHSHQFVPVNKCIIARPEINEALTVLEGSEVARQLLGITEELEIQWNPASSRIAFIFQLKRKPRPMDIKRGQALIDSYPLLESLLFSGDNFATITLADNNAKQYLGFSFQEKSHSSTINMEWETGGFCQVNMSQNTGMIQTVIDLARIKSSEKVLDLFCGMGNFSIPLAAAASSVYGIEGQGASIRSAKRNSTLNNFTNTTFVKADISKGCDKLLAEGKSFDCTILDPPRQGIPELAEKISKLTRKRMVYVSCDPATLCRDLGQLLPYGFIVKAIQPIDMFPQTHHIETVVLLEKN